MNENNQILSIFKRKRLEHGLTIEDIYKKTKIRMQILNQIDNGDLTNIEPIYAMSFLKSIAGVLKIDNNELNDIFVKLGYKKVNQKDYTENLKTINSNFKSSLLNQDKKMLSNIRNFLDVKYLNYAIYFFLVLLIVSILYFTFFESSDKVANLPIKQIDTLKIENNSNQIENYYVPDSLVFEARGLDTAWLRIVIDGKNSEQIIMYPKMERKWFAKKFVQLALGNGGAVEFKRNGKVLEPFGSKGAVVRNVKITPTEVLVSSAPWSMPRDTTGDYKKYYVPKKKDKDKKKIEQQVNTEKKLEPSGVQETFKPFQDKKR